MFPDGLKTPYDILSYEVKDFFSNLSSVYTNLQKSNIKTFTMKKKNTKKYQTITIYKKCINIRKNKTQQIL